MPFKVRYATQAEIPEHLRPDFELVNGAWVLKQDAIEGGAAHLNPGLAANRDALLAEKQGLAQRVTAAEARAQQLEAELATLRAPGAVVLKGDDAKTWQQLSTLGDVKTIKEAVAGYPQLQAQLAQISKDNSLRELAEKAKINFVALKDQLLLPGRESIKIEMGKVDVTGADGKPAQIEAPIVVTTTVTDGVTRETRTALQEYAKANWSEYAVAAIFPSAQNQQTGGNLPFTPVLNVPPTGPATKPAQTGLTAISELVEQFNKQRDTLEKPVL